MTEEKDNTKVMSLLEQQSNEKEGLDALRAKELQSKIDSGKKEDDTRHALAYWVLIAILGIFLVTIMCAFASTFDLVDPKFVDKLFDLWRTGLLPIVTFILGYYFSKKQ